MLRWTLSRGKAIDRDHATAVARHDHATVVKMTIAKVTTARMTERTIGESAAAASAAVVSEAAANGAVAVAAVAGDDGVAVDLGTSGAAVAKAGGEARAESGGAGAEVWRGAPVTAVGTV